MIEGSFFPNIVSVVPERFNHEWSDIVAYLQGCAEIPAHPNQKDWTQCITPCVYATGTNRKKDNAESWNWFAADIDNKLGNMEHSTIEAVAEKCFALNLQFVIYTTTSSKMDAQCFRLMFPLNRRVDFDEYPVLWNAVAAWLKCVDVGTKDISRLFITPRNWEGSEPVFFASDDGQPLDVDKFKLSYPPIAAPAISRATRRAFTDTTGLLPVSASQVSLYGEFVTPSALAKAQSSEKGSRMFGFLVSVGTTAMLKGYDIQPDDLADIGHELAQSMNRHTNDIKHDARNAYNIALGHYADLKAQRFDSFSNSSKHDKLLSKWGIKR